MRGYASIFWTKNLATGYNICVCRLKDGVATIRLGVKTNSSIPSALLQIYNNVFEPPCFAVPVLVLLIGFHLFSAWTAFPYAVTARVLVFVRNESSSVNRFY